MKEDDRNHNLVERSLGRRDQLGHCHSFALPDVRAAFTSVRDIPYAAQYQLFGADHRLLTAAGEGCTQKALRLESLFTSLGLETVIRRVHFYWSAVLAGLYGIPDRLLVAAAPLGPRWHVYLSVKLPHREIIVDPTWDEALHHTGLPVNIDFEPNANMALAVPPYGTGDLLDPSTLVVPTDCCPPTQKDCPAGREAIVLHKQYYVFVLRFNQWLVQQRAVSK